MKYFRDSFTFDDFYTMIENIMPGCHVEEEPSSGELVIYTGLALTRKHPDDVNDGVIDSTEWVIYLEDE